MPFTSKTTVRRRRVGLFSLEEYESARASFEAAHALEARRETATWIRKCDAELQGAAAAASSRLLPGPRDWSALSSPSYSCFSGCSVPATGSADAPAAALCQVWQVPLLRMTDEPKDVAQTRPVPRRQPPQRHESPCQHPRLRSP